MTNSCLVKIVQKFKETSKIHTTLSMAKAEQITNDAHNCLISQVKL